MSQNEPQTNQTNTKRFGLKTHKAQMAELKPNATKLTSLMTAVGVDGVSWICTDWFGSLCGL
jgi:hypothetical protein